MRERIAEHLNFNGISEVSKHIRAKHILSGRDDWEINILGNEKDNLKRKIKEAFFIAKIQPSLNKTKGLNVINMKNLNF